jgi:hypothetical protein
MTISENNEGDFDEASGWKFNSKSESDISFDLEWDTRFDSKSNSSFDSKFDSSFDSKSDSSFDPKSDSSLDPGFNFMSSVSKFDSESSPTINCSSSLLWVAMIRLQVKSPKHPTAYD